MTNGMGGSDRFCDAANRGRESFPPRFGRMLIHELDADAAEPGLATPIAWENG
jgi:hypothetical protein